MPGLELLSAETISHSYKAAREIFLGGERPAEQKEAESDEVTNVEGHENLPPQDKQELGQCHRYLKKGQQDSRCKQQATVFSCFARNSRFFKHKLLHYLFPSFL